MTATSAIEKIEDLIEVATHRLSPQALQRLSTAEILGEYATRNKATPLTLPSKDDLGVPVELEVAYSQLIKFLRLHEPTGNEKDATHKREVVRFLSLKQMLRECQLAKLPHFQTACLRKVVEWFEDTSITMGSGSASAPILPPRMSPKKAATEDPGKDGVSVLARASSQDTLISSSGALDMMKKAAVAQKLESYRMPDLRASHIRRVAQLKSRGVDVPEEELQLLHGAGPEEPDHLGDDVLEPGDYEKRARRAKIKSTFNSYEPETDAEFVMNQVWLERKREEELEKQKAREVRGKLQTWSMNKSREESEYLRKHEAMQLAAGLEKLVDDEYEAVHAPPRRHLDKKRQEWQALQQSGPRAIVVDVEQANDSARATNDRASGALVGGPAPARPSRSGGGSSEIGQTPKKKKLSSGAGGSGGGGPSTPVGSGGMHFRNQLPANYTPQSKRSNGTPTSFPSSKDSPSTASTPLSTSSSGKLQLLDEAAARVESRAHRMGRGGGGDSSSDSPFPSDGSPATQDEGDDERIETNNSFQPAPKFSERVQDTRQQLKFQPFFPSSHTQQGTLPLSRAVSTSALSRKFYPRGTIPPQAEPLDPEYRHLHTATASRKPPLPVSILPDKPLSGLTRNTSVAKVGSGSGNNQSQQDPSTTTRRVSLSSKRAPSGSHGGFLSEIQTEQLMSDLRAEQVHEVERIRILFEQHNLSLSPSVLERGLLVPEDKSTLECVQNLPLPGCRLIANPLLKVKVKTTKKTKKTKKTKGTKGGKSKSKTSAGDKSPKKKKKNK